MKKLGPQPKASAPRLRGYKPAALLLLALTFTYIWILLALIKILNAPSFANVNDASMFAPTAGELLDKNTHPADKADSTSAAVAGNNDPEANRGTVANITTTLAFVHIPKTGGSTIEVAARDQASMRWGYYGWKDTQINRSIYLWHMPPSILPAIFEGREKKLGVLPYEGHRLFAVMRNPFSRAISTFFSNCRLSNNTYCSSSKKKANRRIRKKLTEQLKCNNTDADPCYVYRGNSHWIPQWHYLYDRRSGERRVDFLLHFEHLSRDFDALMRAHSLDISLGHTKRQRVSAYGNATKGKYKNFTGIADLEESTVRMIIKLYRFDFKIGGYFTDTEAATSYASHGNTFWELPRRVLTTQRAKAFAKRFGAGGRRRDRRGAGRGGGG